MIAKAVGHPRESGDLLQKENVCRTKYSQAQKKDAASPRAADTVYHV